ncbi:helix-turn-helix domain-containing protein [Limnobacter sp.]|uniref:helix-turn-helix domain-containing protein n=1 Tax=Limnobacter sp. TaxID=2003368 RepID=UPI0027B8A2F2|nr:helix-turn-helix domain-containing protein [Limnobacter sp.]
MQINVSLENSTKDGKPLTHWFHMFASMIDNNEIADMGTQAFAVYCVIKRHTGYASGDSFPGIELIAQRCGLCQRQVMREISELVARGYIAKRKIGRRNCYEINEKLSVITADGEKAMANFQYIPSLAQQCVREINTLLTSNEKSGRLVNINIENMTLNLQVVNDNSKRINNIGSGASIESEITNKESRHEEIEQLHEILSSRRNTLSKESSVDN